MPLNQQRPLLYLITSGLTSEQTTSLSDEYKQILSLTEAAVASGIDLLQIREKNLTTRGLSELTSHAAEITRGTQTQLLINDRADVAASVEAGVHLTTQSIPVDAVRTAFGPKLLIGVSTHSLHEAQAAKAQHADFIVFGPVFESLSKPTYGRAPGVEVLKNIVTAVSPFPVIALGGLKLENVEGCARAGAAGVAAITMFNDPGTLKEVASEVRLRFNVSD